MTNNPEGNAIVAGQVQSDGSVVGTLACKSFTHLTECL